MPGLVALPRYTNRSGEAQPSPTLISFGVTRVFPVLGLRKRLWLTETMTIPRLYPGFAPEGPSDPPSNLRLRFLRSVCASRQRYSPSACRHSTSSAPTHFYAPPCDTLAHSQPCSWPSYTTKPGPAHRAVSAFCPRRALKGHGSRARTKFCGAQHPQAFVLAQNTLPDLEIPLLRQQLRSCPGVRGPQRQATRAKSGTGGVQHGTAATTG